MLEYISWKLDRERIILKLQKLEKEKQAADYTQLFKNSGILMLDKLINNTDLTQRISHQDQGKSLKIMVHQAKRRVMSSKPGARVNFIINTRI